MKIDLRLADGSIRKVEQPAEGASSVGAAGTCPNCDADSLRVAGAGRRIAGHDVYVADAYCLNCRQKVGELRVRVSTIFGLEEDERVLYGRARVY